MEYKLEKLCDMYPKKDFWKDKRPFGEIGEDDICYISEKGNEYTKVFLLDIFRGNGEYAAQLFGSLNGDDLEGQVRLSTGLTSSFNKCPFCGALNPRTIHFADDIKGGACAYCRPVRTRGQVRLSADPYNDNRHFCSRKSAVFREGLTFLVGCNGIGKSTLIKDIQGQLKERGTPCLVFDNLGEEGGEGRGHHMFGLHALGVKEAYGEKIDGMEALNDFFSLSEGEKIFKAFRSFFYKVRACIEEYRDFGELWLLFDAIDSGLSVNIIDEIKRSILPALRKMAPDDMQLYVIMSCNSYEMCNGYACFSVHKGKYVSIKTYGQFHKEVLGSWGYKVQRDSVFSLYRKIEELPVKQDLCMIEVKDKRYLSSFELPPFTCTVEKGDYKMTVFKKDCYYGYGARLYKKGSKGWRKLAMSCEESHDIEDMSAKTVEDVPAEAVSIIDARIFADMAKEYNKKTFGRG